MVAGDEDGHTVRVDTPNRMTVVRVRRHQERGNVTLSSGAIPATSHPVPGDVRPSSQGTYRRTGREISRRERKDLAVRPLAGRTHRPVERYLPGEIWNRTCLSR